MKNVQFRWNYVWTGLFLLSQGYWLYWLWRGVYYFRNGLESGWFISSLSNHQMLYGVDTISETIQMMILYTILTPCILIPIYQVLYVLVIAIRFLRRT